MWDQTLEWASSTLMHDQAWAVRRQHAGILLREVHENHPFTFHEKTLVEPESSHGSRPQTEPLSSVKFAHFAPDFANFRK
jgi:hypothetical protein